VEIEAEIWLRGDVHATSRIVASTGREPKAWTDGDVNDVLVGMLRAIDHAKNPEADGDRPVSLRGFSWIVNPYEQGVVIAIELSLGAIVAGPFDIAERELTTIIERVIAADRAKAQSGSTTETIH